MGNSPAVVTHLYRTVPNADLDGLAIAHEVFIDAVVNDLFEQDVNAVIRTGPVPQLADVHARTKPDVLLPIQ